MSRSAETLRLAVVVAYGGLRGVGTSERLRDGMSALGGRLRAALTEEYVAIEVDLWYVAPADTVKVAEMVPTCAVVVLDDRQCDERLALFVGRLQGAGVPCTIACHEDVANVVRDLKFNGPDLIAYTSLRELVKENGLLERELLRAITGGRIHDEAIYRFWFPRETSTIWVVCPQIHSPGEFAERSSPDYTYLDNLGDTDALLDVMVFLSQYYPNATVERFSAADLPHGHTSGNLVVIGGPGSPGEISNDICREMMSEVDSYVTYSSDCEQMIISGGGDGNVVHEAEYLGGSHVQECETREPLGLRQDYGYFARFRNPLNENATVVLINGIHTAGVLGAARAFGERREALRNFLSVFASKAKTTRFECYFKVPVLNGQVKVPVVGRDEVLPLDRTENYGAGRRTTETETSLETSNRTSVRVLFIVGDRGGSQGNQLQTTKEYDAIKNALRGCQHRDVIALANPIFGATREKVAVAYRERPMIVHFAGHGDERSVSIIEDHGIFANETPLDGEQLCEVLRTMEQQVVLCVLNACTSEALAKELVAAGSVQHAIGWPCNVSDSVAIAFSGALYSALGDGRSVRDAVRVATIASGPENRPSFIQGENADAPVVGGRER